MLDRYNFIQSKIMDIDALKRKVRTWKMQNEKVVFTNGCFDILHKGHVSYLAQAAGCGSKLIVGLNTDSSVKRQGKGEDRPVNQEDARALVMAALGFVDAVVFFDGDTPIDLITELKPDVLTKGADYNPIQEDKTAKDYIVGSDIVKSNGGEVIAIPFVEGFSTTSTIQKLQGSK